MKANILSYSINEKLIDKRLESLKPKVVSVGQIYLNKENENEFINENYHCFVFTTKGQACAFKSDTNIEFEAEELIYLAPYEKIIINHLCLPFKAYCIYFTIREDMYRYYLEKCYLNNKSIPDSKHQIHNLMEMMFKDSKQNGIANYFKITSMMNALLIDVYRISAKDRYNSLISADFKTSITLNTYENAVNYIKENMEHGVKIHNVTEYLNVSSSYLYQVFIKHGNISPQSYLKEYRIEKAKDLLNHDLLSVKDIAYKLGFLSPNHFSAYFKEHVGVTPKDYRKQIKI